MTLFLYFSTILVNLIFSLMKKNKYKKIISKIIIVFTFIAFFILTAGYRNYSGLSNDLYNNQYEFENLYKTGITDYEVGYFLLMKLGLLITNDFYIFRSVVIFILLLFTFKQIIKKSNNFHLIFSFLSVYLIILNAEQFRYFIGSSFFWIGLLGTINFTSYKFYIRLNITVILAALFHISFLLYLILNLYFLHKFKFFKTIMILFIIFNVFLIYALPFYSNFLEYIFNFFGYGINSYLYTRTNFGFFIPVILHLFSLFILIFLSPRHKFLPFSEKLKYNLILDINYLSFLFYPLFLYQIHFYRYIRTIQLPNYFIYSNNVIMEKRNLFRITQLLLIFFNLSIWILFDLVIKTKPEAVLIPFFRDNIFL